VVALVQLTAGLGVPFGRRYRRGFGRAWLPGGLTIGTLSAAMRWSTASTARLAWTLIGLSG